MYSRPTVQVGAVTAGPYLSHEGNAFLLGRVQVPYVQGDHHFAQEGVSAQAAVVPDGDGQGLVRQLLATDDILVERRRGIG